MVLYLENDETIVEKLSFAGKSYEYSRQINDKDREKFEKEKQKATNVKLDSLVNEIERKKNVNVVEKTKRDWDCFVKKKQIEKELSFARKDGFLNRKRFIEETAENERQLGRERKSLNKNNV